MCAGRHHGGPCRASELDRVRLKSNPCTAEVEMVEGAEKDYPIGIPGDGSPLLEIHRGHSAVLPA